MQLGPHGVPIIQDINNFLPTSLPHDENTYYVRNCYDKYYNLILERNREYRLITITGTPGIGKSIFYHYFFDRYVKEHPTECVVTAAFTKEREMSDFVVYDPNQSPSFIQHSVHLFNVVCRDYPGALHLYDGPPKAVPSKSPMVTFTSPNSGWFAIIAKIVNAHCRLFMPVWEYLELWEAIHLLRMPLTENELFQRYQKFGGIARFCLAANQRNYLVALETFEQAISKISKFEDIQTCFDNGKSMENVVHQLLHYVPREDPTFAFLRIGSHEIGTAIFNKLHKQISLERLKLMYWLEVAAKASTFYGWLFETIAHERLINGDALDCLTLEAFGRKGRSMEIAITPASKDYQRFQADITLEIVFKNVYHIAEAQNFKSIDSFYFTKNNVYLFQFTTSLDHSVNPVGLISVLTKLKRMEAVQQNPKHACLIFVVPSPMGASFKRQRIKSQQIFDENWMTKSLAIIPGISPLTRSKLSEKRILTCADLDNARNDISISNEVNQLDEFRRRADILRAAQLENITQCVLEVDVEPSHLLRPVEYVRSVLQWFHLI